MIRTIYIPKKEIQVIDLRNLCKRKKQLEAIDVSLCPKSTAIVQDQDGNELARENIASGATGIIPVNVGGDDATIRFFDEQGTLLRTDLVPSGDTQDYNLIINLVN